MANEQVTIEIKAAVDQANKALAEVNSQLSKLGDTTQKTSKGFAGTGLTLTDIKSGLDMAGKALEVVGQAFDQTAGKAVAYAEQVRDLGRISGASAEETSRLIQTADDLKVSYETLTQAARGAAKNGIALTTEEVAKLSDEYLAIEDPAKRAAFAMEKFGRAGLEMTKILETGGDAIREMAASTSKNLIMTDAQVKKAREFEQAQDALNDTLEGFKLAIGNSVLPAIVDFLKGLDDLINREEKLKGKTLQASTSYEDYLEALNKAQAGTDRYVNELGQLVSVYRSDIGVTESVIDANYALSRGEYDLAKAVNEGVDERQRMIDAGKRAQQVIAAMEEENRRLEKAEKDLVMLAMKPLTEAIFEQQVMATLSADALLEYGRRTGKLSEESYIALKSLQAMTKELDTNGNEMVDAKEATEEYWAALAKLNGQSVLVSLRADFSDWERALEVSNRLLEQARAGGNWTPGTPWNNPTPVPPPTSTPTFGGGDSGGSGGARDARPGATVNIIGAPNPGATALEVARILSGRGR